MQEKMRSRRLLTFLHWQQEQERIHVEAKTGDQCLTPPVLEPLWLQSSDPVSQLPHILVSGTMGPMSAGSGWY